MKDFKSGDQFDDCDVICPHCGHSFQPVAGDFDENVTIEECGKCKKEFKVWAEFSVTYYTEAK